MRLSRWRRIAWAKTDNKGVFTLEKEVLPFPSYLSVNYRGAWSSAFLKKGEAGVYSTEVIESDARNPYASRRRSDDYENSYNDRDYDRNSGRNSYGRGRASVDFTYGGSLGLKASHSHQTGVHYGGIVRGNVFKKWY